VGDYLLGIDAGSTVLKAAVFDSRGRELAVSSRSLGLVMPRPGWVERPLATAWATIAAVVREAVSSAGIKGKDIACVGTTGHGNGVYLLNAKGQPVRDGVASLDTRADDIVRSWRATGAAEEMRSRTCQALWPGQPNAILAWLKKHEPEQYRAISSVLLVTDYLGFLLTGRIATSYSMMSGTGLMNVFTKSYDAELLDLYGIPEMLGALPRPAESHDIVGTVTAAAARATGLAEGTPVTAGVYDIDGSAIGSGVVAPGQASVVAGTWSINDIVTSEPIRDDSLLMTKRFAIPGLWISIDGSATSTANIDWFITEFMELERREAESRGSSVFERCDDLVAGIKPDESTIIFHPFLFGSDTQANARAGFYGIAGWHTRAHLLRALYEGVVFGHRMHVDRLRSAGAVIGTIRLTGGGSRSPIWAGMFADVLGAQIEIPAGSEVGALGAAMIAGIGVGIFKDVSDATARAVSVARKHAPDQSKQDYFDARFGAYVALARAMAPAWDQLSRLGGSAP
jgi:L-xylulokinase